MPRNEVAAPQAAAATATTEPEVKKVRPVRSTRQYQEADDDKLTQPKPRLQKSTGPAKDSLEPNTVELAERMPDAKKAEELIFMQDIVTVILHDTNEPNADPTPCVTVNGINQFFIRGERVQCKRMFVNRLAEMKRTSYTQAEGVDSSGARAYWQKKHNSLVYPFAVVEDPAGERGRAWLDAKLKAPA